MKALSPQDKFDFISKTEVDLDETEQTVFHCKSLTAHEQSIVENCGTSIVDGKYTLTSGFQTEMVLHLGLVGVSNFKDEQGNEVTLLREKKKTIAGRYERIDDVFLSRIPREIRDEIANEIDSRGRLSESNRKN
jgi:hypothetical protein